MLPHYRLILGLVLAATFNLPFLECSYSASPTGVAPIDLSKLLGLEESLSHLVSIQYSLSSKDQQTEEFRKAIGNKDHSRDVLIGDYSYFIVGDNFYWKSKVFVPFSKIYERETTGNYNNGNLSILFQSNPNVLVVAATPAKQRDLPIVGYNAIMEAFSFLELGSWQDNLSPEITLSDLRSKVKWSEAYKRITSLSEEAFKSQPCIKVEFNTGSGERNVVYFSKNANYFPICWQHYGSGFLTRQVSVTAFAQIKTDGISFFLPKTLEVENYVDGTLKANVCEQTLSGFNINSSINKDDLLIDPTEAGFIFDRDNNTTVTVPK